jgi:hypothetical protein
MELVKNVSAMRIAETSPITWTSYVRFLDTDGVEHCRAMTIQAVENYSTLVDPLYLNDEDAVFDVEFLYRNEDDTVAYDVVIHSH